MPRSAPRHDADAGGPPEVLAAKAALRQEVWSAMRAARVARFPGAEGRIPNFAGAENAVKGPGEVGGGFASPTTGKLPVR
jgi:5-formyltetrahydrofolate cyclo-ligase